MKKKIAKTKKVSLPPKAKPQKPKPLVPSFDHPIRFEFKNDNTQLSFIEKLPISFHRKEMLYVYKWTKASEKGGKLNTNLELTKEGVEKMIRQGRFGDIDIIY